MIKLSLENEKALFEKMRALGVREEDIIEGFVKSSGPGGQNANKTSTCVYLKHLPTGIKVKYQRERYQVLNRQLARKLLLEKIQARKLKKIAIERQRVEKVRRQKRKRSQRAKFIMLEHKRKHSLKKSLRSKVREVD
ncbi:MAG: peptide chain release factor-like protein [Candidatus Omnitrophica bacterium]|nr:peptide chain release factor-like protein [Candidatus Omnitrophota bacterium]